MILHVVSARYRGEYKIWLSFNNGTSGMVDLGGSLCGSMFKPLKDKRLFKKLHVDPELGTIVWENGADLAPEYLKGLLAAYPKCKSKSTLQPRKLARKKSELSSRSFRPAKKALAR